MKQSDLGKALDPSAAALFSAVPPIPLVQQTKTPLLVLPVPSSYCQKRSMWWNTLKGHKNENFFGSKFGILHYCIVNYAEILSLCPKFFLIRPIREDTIIPLSLRLGGIGFSLI